MSCDIKISEYIDGLLPDDERKVITEHISVCGECHDKYELTMRIVAAAAELPEVEPPNGFREQLMLAVREESAQNGYKMGKPAQSSRVKSFAGIKRSYVFIGASAACVVFACLFVIFGSRGGTVNYSKSAMYDGQMATSATATAAAPAAPAPAPAAIAPTAPQEAPRAHVGLSNGGLLDIRAELEYGGEYGGEYGREVLIEEAAADMVTSAAGAPDAQSSASMPESASGAADTNIAQKIIKTSYYDLQVTEYDLTVSKIQQITLASGGFVESLWSGIYQTYPGPDGVRDLKNGHICIRIPQNEYDIAKIKIEDLGKITSESENIENITKMYVDMAARLDVKRSEEQRLLELYAKAEEIEDLIALETRLTYVRSDIESMISQLQNWDRSVSYSTINITINEVIDYSQAQPLDPTLSEQIKEGFNRSITAFTRGMERFIIGFAENSIALLILASAAFIIISAVSVIIRKRRVDKDEI